MSSQLTPPESLLGAQIRVTTTFGEDIEGELFCIDNLGSRSVVICERLPNGNVNYKWVKANIIREVSASAGPASNATEESLPHVDLKYVEGRAKKAEDTAAADSKKYGVGVTEHAQDVFDALSKTMEASWDGEDIKVLGVRITKPYDPARNISGDDMQVVERVRKVLQSELGRKKKSSQPSK